jgi:hypothetical protein
MAASQCTRSSSAQLGGFALRHTPARDARRERFAGNEFEHEIVHAALMAEVVDDLDVRVVQP